MKAVILLFGIAASVSSLTVKADASELENHVAWTVFHEGCRAWKGTSLMPSDEFKACAEAVERHNPAAVAIIKAANNDEVQSALSEAVRTIPTTYQLVANFSWVLEHEHQGNQFHVLKAQGNFGQIRYLYSLYQQHNPNARNLLAAVSDTTISDLIP